MMKLRLQDSNVNVVLFQLMPRKTHLKTPPRLAVAKRKWPPRPTVANMKTLFESVTLTDVFRKTLQTSLELYHVTMRPCRTETVLSDSLCAHMKVIVNFHITMYTYTTVVIDHKVHRSSCFSFTA